MARLNSPTKNKKTSIIVITGDDDVLQNLLSTIEKSDNLTESIDIKRHDVCLFRIAFHPDHRKLSSRFKHLHWMKENLCINVAKLISLVSSVRINALDTIFKLFRVAHANLFSVETRLKI